MCLRPSAIHALHFARVKPLWLDGLETLFLLPLFYDVDLLPLTYVKRWSDGAYLGSVWFVFFGRFT